MRFTVQDRSRLCTRQHAGHALLTASAWLLLASAAAASPGVALEQYRAPGASWDGFATARPDAGEHLRFEARLSLDYAHDPLVYETRRSTSQTEQVRLVSDQFVAQLGVSLGVIERLLFFASLPVNLVMEGTRFGPQPTATGFGAGDLAAGARALLVRGAPGALGIELAVTLPTGEGSSSAPAVAGDAGATFLPTLLGETSFGLLRVTANVGLRVRKTVTLPGGARFANQLTYALALSLPLGSEAWRAQAEVFGSTLTDNAGLRASSPLEALLGLKVLPNAALTFGLAGGMGLLRGYGAPDFRIIAQVAWHTALRDEPRVAPPALSPAEPIAAPPPPPPPPPEPAPKVADLDHDDLEDQDDACPALAGRPELRGCPEHVSYARASGLVQLTPLPSFARGSANLAPHSLVALESLARALAAGPSQRVIVEDHLEPTTKGDLVVLSRARARALATWLTQHGVSAAQLEPYACADTRPLGTKRRDRALNERSEIYLVNPLPELGMPSTLNCLAAPLPTPEPAAPEPAASAANGGVSTRLGPIAQRATTDADADGIFDRSKWRGRVEAHPSPESGAKRTEAYGCGASKPLALNNAPGGRKKNERIDLVLLDPTPNSGVRSSEGCVSSE